MGLEPPPHHPSQAMRLAGEQNQTLPGRGLQSQELEICYTKALFGQSCYL